MVRLLYISTARSLPDGDMLKAILATSRTRNAASNITGLLVAGGRRFLQALEGPRDNVMATYERISSDPRHFALVTLSMSEAPHRVFPAWSMGYRRSHWVNGGIDPSLTLDSLVDAIAEPTIKAYFEQFVIRHLAA